MRKLLLLVMLLPCILLSGYGETFGATFYVNNGTSDGSYSDNPNCTDPSNIDCDLDDAIGMANWNTEDDTIIINTDVSGQEEYWIGGNGGYTLTIEGNGHTINGRFSISDFGTAGVTIQNLTIDGSSTTCCEGIYAYNRGANNFHLENVTVQNAKSAGLAIVVDTDSITVGNIQIENSNFLNNNWNGVYIASKSSIQIDGITITDVTVQGNSGNGIDIEGNLNNVQITTTSGKEISGNSGVGIGIYENNESGTSYAPQNVIIDGYEIHDNTGEGIEVYSDRTAKINAVAIQNCKVYNNNGDGIKLQGNVESSSVDNSEIHDNDQSGISILSSANYSPKNNIIKRSAIYQNNGAGINIYGTITDTLS